MSKSGVPSYWVDVVDTRTGLVLERRVRRSDASATIALARMEGNRHIKMVPNRGDGAKRNPDSGAFKTHQVSRDVSDALASAGFRDTSWANDESPSFTHRAARLKVYVGPLDKRLRSSLGMRNRFMAVRVDEDGLDEGGRDSTLLETDDLRSVIGLLRREQRNAKSKHGRRNPGPFDGAEIIHAYTRKQAIEDGTLVDVTEWASDKKGFVGGFTVPVAMTRALWSAVEAVPKGSGQDIRGRAHDVLWMASLAIRAGQRRGMFGPSGGSADFLVILSVGRKKKQRLRVDLGGGDDGKPVATIGFPEDF